MSEPVDSSERNPVKKESTSEKAIKIWAPLLLAQTEGKPLTPEQQRAIEIRSICLSLINALDPLIDDSNIQDNPEQEAELVARYHEAVLRLEERGIERDMKVEQPEEFYNDPLNRAEYVAGQLLVIEGNQLLNARQIGYQAREHAEMITPLNEGENLYGLSNDKVTSSTYMEWTVARGTLAAQRQFLAPDLGIPS